MASFPRLVDEVQGVGLDFPRSMLRLALADGRVVMVPLTFDPTLAAATTAQRKAWEYLPFGIAVEWPALDLQFSVESIIVGGSTSRRRGSPSERRGRLRG